MLHSHKRNWTADIVVRVGQHNGIHNQTDIHQAWIIVIPSLLIPWEWLIVKNDGFEIRMLLRRLPQVIFHGMHCAVARTMHEYHVPARGLQYPIEHADHRSEANTATDQHYGRGSVDVDVKISVRCSHFEGIAYLDPIMQRFCRNKPALVTCRRF